MIQMVKPIFIANMSRGATPAFYIHQLKPNSTELLCNRKIGSGWSVVKADKPTCKDCLSKLKKLEKEKENVM